MPKGHPIKQDYVLTDAELSNDLRYRYTLVRAFENPPKSILGFCGLNPSTADWHKDDQTIRTEAGWTRQLGYQAFMKVNLWPFRARYPNDLYQWALYSQPVFHVDCKKFEVQYAIKQLVDSGVKMCICCWGTSGSKKFAALIEERGKKFTQAAIDAGLILSCIDITKDGHPGHPLYKKITGNIHPWGTTAEGYTHAKTV